MRVDEARKARIVANFPRVAAAMDGLELAQASALELAARALATLGLPTPDGADPVALIESYLAGRAAAASGGVGSTDRVMHE